MADSGRSFIVIMFQILREFILLKYITIKYGKKYKTLQVILVLC